VGGGGGVGSWKYPVAPDAPLPASPRCAEGGAEGIRCAEGGAEDVCYAEGGTVRREALTEGIPAEEGRYGRAEPL